MKRYLYTISAVCLFYFTTNAQITDPKATEVWQPEPRTVAPGEGAKPPSDAVILFDGQNPPLLGSSMLTAA